MDRIDCPYPNDIIINGKKYIFPKYDFKTDGNRVWTISLALCQHTPKGKTIELGAGLGLISMVHNCVALDKDATFIRESTKLNNSNITIIEDDWNNINDRYDSIIGSEIFYPGYNINSILDFIKRCWTGKGILLFGLSRWQHLNAIDIPLKRSIKLFEGQEYMELTNG